MGWYLKDFRVGERFETRARTITEYDIHQFAQFTGDWNPVHVDEVTAQAEHGGRIAHGPMFPGIAFGLLSQFNLVEGTVVALKEMSWEFMAPVHIGDTVRLVMEVTSVSPHPKRTDRGRVGYRMEFLNQRNEVVNRGTATAVMQTEREIRKMVKAVQIQAFGDADAMQIVDVEVGDPGPDQIRIRHEACGLNFIDVYQRSGVYPLPLPVNLGMEGAGVVEAVGEGVTHLKEGDRAAYAGNPPGSYCEARVMPATQVCKLPDSISFETGAAMMLKGLTTQYLLRSTGKLSEGDTVLFHAAAGGVGLIACQWARAIGLRLIGTAGSDEKCRLAESFGAEICINYNTEDWVARVKDLTDGKGVDFVADSVGKATWDGSLDCLRPMGIMATYGNASGKPDPVDPQVLAGKGSLYLTRPTLFTHIATREACQERADDLFDMVGSGKVSIEINQRYPLTEIAQAHKDLEARKTTGATVILP